jgi:hypothetical protein
MDMTVWVVQSTNKLDENTGKLVPKFDFTPATRFGTVNFLLSPSASPFSLQTVMLDLHAKLKHFNSRDFLLCAGSPVLLGLACAVAAHYNDGDVNLLQWSGAKRAYVPVFAKNIFAD